MGQKVNPIGFRLNAGKEWQSAWYSSRNYAELLHQDIKIRELIIKATDHFGISKIEIERPGNAIKIGIYAARPGLIIGRKGEELDKLKQKLTHLTKTELQINIKEVKRAETDAKLIAKNIGGQLERRVAFRRVIKKAMQGAMRYNIGGCKIMVSGRLNGADIARTEWIREGRIPLHTIKADIDYATREAMTIYGLIGIKVWIYKTVSEFGRVRKAGQDN